MTVAQENAVRSVADDLRKLVERVSRRYNCHEVSGYLERVRTQIATLYSLCSAEYKPAADRVPILAYLEATAT